MKAFNCFVVICAGLLVSSDFAFGLSFGVLQLRAERKVDNEAAPSDDVFVPVTDDLLKKVERRIAKMQESAIREINNQGSPESLLDNLQNKTTKQLKIVGDKLIQTEEKVVSLGTKDNATIAIYKIINVRPLSFFTGTEAEKSDFSQPTEQTSEPPIDKTEAEKSDSSQPTEQPSENSVDKTESENSDSDSDQPSEHASESSDSSSDEPRTEPETSTSENTQTVAENQQPAQNDHVVEQDQPAQNESVQNQPVIMLTGPDGIPKPIHGIAIKIAPKSDGSQGKDVAFQFFRK